MYITKELFEIMCILDGPTLDRDAIETIVQQRRQLFEQLRAIPEQGIEVDYLGHSYTVIPSVFTPHEDSKALVSNMLIHDGDSVLDLCSGSGVIGIEAALRGAGRVVCVDKNPQATLCAQRNARRYNCDTFLEARTGNMFDVVSENREFDVIACNPPFTAQPAADNFEIIMHDQNHDAHSRLFNGFDLRLKPGGRLYFTHTNFATSVRPHLAQVLDLDYEIRMIGRHSTLEANPRE